MLCSTTWRPALRSGQQQLPFVVLPSAANCPLLLPLLLLAAGATAAAAVGATAPAAALCCLFFSTEEESAGLTATPPLFKCSTQPAVNSCIAVAAAQGPPALQEGQVAATPRCRKQQKRAALRLLAWQHTAMVVVVVVWWRCFFDVIMVLLLFCGVLVVDAMPCWNDNAITPPPPPPPPFPLPGQLLSTSTAALPTPFLPTLLLSHT